MIYLGRYRLIDSSHGTRTGAIFKLIDDEYNYQFTCDNYKPESGASKLISIKFYNIDSKYKKLTLIDDLFYNFT
jgi:hypothetical protein